MRKLTLLASSWSLAFASDRLQWRTARDAACRSAGARNTGHDAIEYSGTGRWFQFGQAAEPHAALAGVRCQELLGPHQLRGACRAGADGAHPGRRAESRAADPGSTAGRSRSSAAPTPGTWPRPAGAAPGTAPTPQPQPAAVEERTMEIWTTPHGFLKAAAANNATSQPVDGGSEVSFTVGGKYRYVGRINAQNQVERVQTWIDNPVLGDTPVEVAYSDYRDFSGIMFPARIVRTQGGHPVLELTVSSVTKNPAVDIQVPDQVRSFTPPPVTVDGREARRRRLLPQGRQPSQRRHRPGRSRRGRRGARRTKRARWRSSPRSRRRFPNKPIRYIVNSHVHFDHSGGLRTYVAEGATVVTHEMNRPYYEQAWAAPRTLNPDRWPSAARPPRSRRSPRSTCSPTAAGRSRSIGSPATATTTRSRWCICPRSRFSSRWTRGRRSRRTRRRRRRRARSPSISTRTSSGSSWTFGRLPRCTGRASRRSHDLRSAIGPATAGGL